MALSPAQYDVIEHAVAWGRRLSLTRRGYTVVVIPTQLALRAGREVLDAHHPSTLEPFRFYLDEVDRVEAVR